MQRYWCGACVYCRSSEVTFSLCYIIILQIWINNCLSNKYHRRWCTLVVRPDWVGHPVVTSVHFGPTACSALWLITYCSNGLTLRLTVTINLGVSLAISCCCKIGFFTMSQSDRNKMNYNLEFKFKGYLIFPVLVRLWVHCQMINTRNIKE